MVPATVTFSHSPGRVARICRYNGRCWLLALLLGSLLLSGCSTLSGVLASKMFTAVGMVSLAASGKGIADHALTLLLQQDCRILDGVLREDRDICEPEGSPATWEDFKGVIAMLNDDEEDPALAETYRFEPSDKLALELSNMTGRSAGDVPPEQSMYAQPVTYQLRLDTRLPGRQRLTSPQLLAGLTVKL